MNKFITSVLFLFSLGVYDVFAQGYGYSKDSLQFKVYTFVTFKESYVKDIKIHRVFCDYCSDSQLATLGQFAIKLSKKLAKKPENRVINGEKRFTIKFRIAKKDFANINRKDTIN